MHFHSSVTPNNDHRDLSLDTPFQGYESDSTDCDDSRPQDSATPPTLYTHSHSNNFLFPPRNPSRHSSLNSTTHSTPVPSRSPSPHPHPSHQFYPSGLSSSCPSDTDDEPNSPLLSWSRSRNSWWREQRGQWWGPSRRRRRRSWRITRLVKRWLRSVIRHPLFPSQPITIVRTLSVHCFSPRLTTCFIQVLTLILLSIFAILLTLLLIYILNPDKEPLPWRAYCAYPSIYNTREPPPSSAPYPNPNSPQSPVAPFPPPNLDHLPPAGIFLGVFSVDSAFERRQLVRSTWASHPRSRHGAGKGDDGVGTSRTIVRFVVGQPRKDLERRIKLEMESMYSFFTFRFIA